MITTILFSVAIILCCIAVMVWEVKTDIETERKRNGLF